MLSLPWQAVVRLCGLARPCPNSRPGCGEVVDAVLAVQAPLLRGQGVQGRCPVVVMKVDARSREAQVIYGPAFRVQSMMNRSRADREADRGTMKTRGRMFRKCVQM